MEPVIETATPDTYTIKHPTTHRDVILPAKIGDGDSAIETKTFIEAIIGKSRGEARGALSHENATLKARVAEFEKLQLELEEQQTATLSTKDRLEKDAARVAKQVADSKAEAERYKSRFQASTLKNEILKQAGTMSGDLVSAADAVSLFMTQCTPKLIENGDEYIVSANLDGAELSLTEAWGKWISSDSKSYLLRNKLASGGGSTGGQRQPEAKTIKISDFAKLSFTEQDSLIKSGVKPVD